MLSFFFFSFLLWYVLYQRMDLSNYESQNWKIWKNIFGLFVVNTTYNIKIKLDKLGFWKWAHSSIHTHTHTNTLARMNEYQGKLSHLYAVSFHRPWNESCSIHIEIWEKRIEDFSKSLHLYVAAGLASVSVLYILVHPDSIKKIKNTLHECGVIFQF